MLVPSAHDDPERAGPGPFWALTLDIGFLVLCYLLSYRLRFPGAELQTFLPGALRTLPLVATLQGVGLAAAGLYRRTLTPGWVLRTILATSAATAAAAALAALVFGFLGVSRVAFAVDLGFVWIGVIGWRALWQLATEGRTVEAAPGEKMVDRTRETDSLPETFAAFLFFAGQDVRVAVAVEVQQLHEVVLDSRRAADVVSLPVAVEHALSAGQPHHA